MARTAPNTIRDALIDLIARRARRQGLRVLSFTAYGEILETTNVVALAAYDAGTTSDAVWAWLDAPVATREARLLAAINRKLAR